MTVWLPVMFRDELELLEMRLEETAAWPARTVLTESPLTHRGMPKPLHYAESRDRFAKWNDSIVHVVADLPDVPPWAREHAQRNAAWPVIDANAEPGDTVIIADLDEIPSSSLMNWRQVTGGRYTVIAARMRTALFAVDWLVPDEVLPPTCVAATVEWLRARAAEGQGLGEVRDRRGEFFQLRDGGWHFSWLGGPAAQQRKLLTSTCHTELLGTEEGNLILSGERYRTGRHAAGHLPVVGADADGTWPAFIRERRCPAEWFRPRKEAACAL
jgi:beta-1,4-mannosyl-glycoprotein beta-1,4-N-acetylglucosaminyltransferase